MTFIIDGFDMTPYIAHQGLKWSRNDVDGPNAGRALNAKMIRDRVATKYRWDVTCIPVTSAQQAIILQKIKPEYVMLTYTDPETNTDKTAEYYSNNVPSTLFTSGRGGLWTGLTFPLIER